MRVLLVFNHEYIVGGGEIAFILYAGELVRRSGFEVFVFVPGKGEVAEKLKEVGVKDIFISDLPSFRREIHRVPFTLRFFVNMYKSFSPDIVHVNGSRAMIYAGLAKLLSRTHVLWHVRISEKDILDPLLVFLSDGVIANSNKTLIRRLSPILRFLDRQARVIYNGFDLNLPHRVRKLDRVSLRRSFGIPEQTFVFSTACRIENGKGLEFIPEALNSIPDSKRTFVLLIAGSGDKRTIEWLKKKIGNYSVFPGHTKVEHILAVSDAIFFPSTIDSFGNFVVEGMMCGLPAAVSRFSGVSEVISHGYDALIFDPSNPQDFGWTLLRIMEDERLRLKLGACAKRKSMEFSIEKHTDKVIEFYKTILRSANYKNDKSWKNKGLEK